MRSFSRLRALCAYPEMLEKPSKRRDDAADLGTAFHSYVQAWSEAVAAGQPWHMDGAASPLVRGWLDRLRDVWSPPAGLEVELALGLAPGPTYVAVDEVAPHIYVPAHMDITPGAWEAAGDEQRRQWQSGLLTAGRADMVAPTLGGDIVVVDDIKTGQYYLGDPKLIRQLLAQGIAATLRANAKGFLPGIYYARLGMFDRGDGHAIWRGTEEWDQAWAFVETAARLPAEPQPGAWCLSCYSKNDCEAYPARKEAA